MRRRRGRGNPPDPPAPQGLTARLESLTAELGEDLDVSYSLARGCYLIRRPGGIILGLREDEISNGRTPTNAQIIGRGSDLGTKLDATQTPQ